MNFYIVKIIFLLIILISQAHQLRIFQESFNFIKSLFKFRNSIDIQGYVLALQWIRNSSFKLAFNCLNYTEFCQISPSTANRFSIHGLWPQGNGNEQLSYCLNDKFNIKLLSPILAEKTNFYWPSLRSKDKNNNYFLAHEYEKHGTCFPSDGDLKERINNYFAKVLSIFEKLNTDKYLLEVANLGIYLYDFLRLHRVEAQVKCRKIENEYHLTEIRFFLDDKFNFVPFRNTKRKCKKSILKPYYLK